MGYGLMKKGAKRDVKISSNDGFILIRDEPTESSEDKKLLTFVEKVLQKRPGGDE